MAEEEKKGTPDGGSNSMPFQPSDSTVAGGGPAVGLGIDSNPFGFGGTPGGSSDPTPGEPQKQDSFDRVFGGGG